MINFIYLFLMFCEITTPLPMFKQNEYQIAYERAEVVRHTDKFGCRAKLTSFKYNRTCTAFNFTFYTPVNYGNDINIVVQAYKFVSNEYRLFPALRFSVNLCDTIKKNDFGLADTLKCGNFSGCDVNKGTYVFCNFYPDYARFPPLIPAGSYMIDLQFMYFSTELILIQGYGTVKYPIV